MVEGRHRGKGKFSAYDGPGVQIVVPGAIAEGIHLDVTLGVTRKGQRAAFVKQRLKPDLVSGQ